MRAQTDTPTEATIRRTWETLAMHALEQFAKEGEGGWEIDAFPVYADRSVAESAPDRGKVTFRFIYRGAPPRRLGAAPRLGPRRFGRKVYEVVGRFDGATATVERLVK